MNRYPRLLPLLAIAFMAATPSLARTPAVCDSLRMRIATLPEATADVDDRSSYASAVTRQNFEIRKTRGDMQMLGCTRSSVIDYGNPNTAQCRTLETALERMEANKRDLLETRRAMNRSTAQSLARRRLLAAYDANGCDEMIGQAIQPQDIAVEPPEPMRPSYEYDDYAGREEEHRQPSFNGRSGNLRTLCVRTCDGAFFPISSNVTPLNFRRDMATCERMCPGTETELYYHSILTQESADMVSASTGRPYREMPNAFVYQSSRPQQGGACGCDMKNFHDNARDTTPSKNGEDAASRSSITEIHTGAKSDSGISVAEETIDPRERPYDPASGAVRQVGPTFLPTETSNIDLKRPALEGPQPLQQ